MEKMNCITHDHKQWASSRSISTVAFLTMEWNTRGAHLSTHGLTNMTHVEELRISDNLPSLTV